MQGRLGIAAKLAFAFTLLVLLVGVVVERLSSAEVEAAMIEQARVELTGRLGLLEHMVENEAAALCAERPLDRAAWDAIADRAGQRAGARVTLVRADGAVVGDSELSEADLAEVENHGAREEIVAARERGEGSAIRQSPTLGTRMIYVVRRTATPEGEVAFVRLALPLSSVDAAVAAARRVLATGSAAVIALGVAISFLGAYVLTRPLRELTSAALAMGRGELGTRAPERGDDEVARLGRALNGLAAALARSLDDLRADRDLLASILDGTGEGVLAVDGSGRVALANGAFRAMTLVRADAVGQPLPEAVRSAAIQKALANVAPGEGVEQEVELAGLLPKKLLVRARRLESSPGGSWIVAVFHDVTELRRLETIRTDFVANVSHELRTPVTAIGTAAETLLAGAADDRSASREFAEIIGRQAERLRQLVDDLLDLTRIEAKGFRLQVADIDVGSVVETTVRLLQEAARRRGVSLAAEGPPDLPRARADRRALEQVLSNLVDNALKYAGEGAHVTVTTGAEGEQVALSVRDDGPGIAAAHLGRIFERFYRVDAGRSRELGGTGLGLSIVKHLVELMDGSIEVESEAGKGTRFTVRLPRAAE